MHQNRRSEGGGIAKIDCIGYRELTRLGEVENEHSLWFPENLLTRTR